MLIQDSKKTKRQRGYICHAQKSPRDGGSWWVIVLAEDGEHFFAHAYNFFGCPTMPHVGANVEFCALPPLPERKLRRAGEVKLQTAP